MKQIIQSFKTGETILEEIPAPTIRKGSVLIETSYSLVSLGKSTVLSGTAATTIAAGFSIFAFSNFTPTVLFGAFTAFALMVSFFASLTLLPFLLNLFNPFKQQET
mgnify:CR=1 FL=1